MGLTPTKKILLAVLSGLLMTASFPPLKTDWLAWIAIIPLLTAVEDSSPKTAFRLGITAGLAHYISLLYWIINVISTYGGLNVLVSGSVLLLLCLYLSAYIGIFSTLVSILKNNRIKILFFAGIWVSLEYIREFIFTGFPWGLLGYSQYNRLVIAQISDITGVYGVSFIIAAFNILFYQLITGIKANLRNKYFLSESLALVLLIFIFYYYGENRLAEYSINKSGADSVNVAVIQGNIDQAVKWSRDFQEKTIEKYVNLSERSLETDPDIIVWPETAVPLFFQDASSLTERISDLAQESKTHLIFGSPAYKTEKESIAYYNSAWYISPEGEVKGRYDKNHLVPFGEYVPLKKLLPFVHRLVPAAGDFSKGDSADPLEMDKISSGILICYEVIFPEIARKQVLNGAGLLINITNDAWFGISGAPYQHLFISVFRAVENRRPLIRSANTGISAIIDATGRMEEYGDIFTEEVITGSVEPESSVVTFYSRNGDIFARGILILCLINIIIGLCYSVKRKKPSYRQRISDR